MVDMYEKKFYEKLASLTGDTNPENYCYAGGRSYTTSHYNYWKTQGYTDEQMPKQEQKCLCGHEIKENCFIRHKPTDKIVVVGNCCIKRYIPASGRTCEVCGKGHKNKKDNRCKPCRMKVKCDKCDLDYNKSELSRIGESMYECEECKNKPRIYINVPFSQKDIAKANGARWEKICKSWYVTGEPFGVLLQFSKHIESKQKEFNNIVNSADLENDSSLADLCSDI